MIWVVEREVRLATKRHSAEQIVRRLREAEIELAKGATVKDACRKLAITERTYDRWRREYGGLKLDQARPQQQLGHSIHVAAGTEAGLTQPPKTDQV
jgi:hypothetical protein